MLNGLLDAKEGNEKAQQMMEKTGSKIKYLKADISQAESCKNLITETNKQFGNGPHILINNGKREKIINSKKNKDQSKFFLLLMKNESWNTTCFSN